MVLLDHWSVLYRTGMVDWNGKGKFLVNSDQDIRGELLAFQSSHAFRDGAQHWGM